MIPIGLLGRRTRRRKRPARPDRRISIDEIRRAAANRGGVCLAPHYRIEKLPFRCAKGHEWHARGPDILRGTWCPVCARQSPRRLRLTIEDLKRYARSRRGDCLSARYEGPSHPLQWRCAEGHEWTGTSKAVKSEKTWCIRCARSAPRANSHDLAFYGALARRRGGRCLATKLGPASEKLEWECRKGHRWWTTRRAVVSGRWCHRCHGMVPAEERLEEIRAFARRKGGACLAKRFRSTNVPLRWRCRKGHEWATSWGNVGGGTWCPHCAGVFRGTIEELKAIAAKRVGHCLSTRHVNNRTPVTWRCEFGHVWDASPGSVKNGHWCPHCAGRAPLTIEQIASDARKRGGRCLTKTLPEGSRSRIRLECAEGHRWSATANALRQGRWCWNCRNRLPSGTAEKAAAARGGRCLSPDVRYSQAPMKWECALGHGWHADLHAIRRGQWCPLCRSPERSVVTLQHLARSRGGRLLNPRQYRSRNRPLRWLCKRGHVFVATPLSVMRDEWCASCRVTRRLDPAKRFRAV